MEWRDLERLIAEIFEGLAFDVILTLPSKDGGKDLILEINKRRIAKNTWLILNTGKPRN